MDLYENKNIKPMLLSESNKPFNNENYIYEIKFDGTRAIIYINKDEIIIKNKRGIILNNTYPELLNIKNMTNNKCIFDGEIIVMDNGVPSFKKLQERAMLKDKIKINYESKNNPVTFICFDILYENKDLIDLPLLERKKLLDKYPDTDYFVKSKVIQNGIKLYNEIKKIGLEGIVAKEKNSKYIPNKRSSNWIKIKNHMENDYYICGYKEEKNIASILLGEKKNNKYKFVSKVILGKNKNDFKLIKKCKKQRNTLIDFNDPNYTYITPKYKCTILYMEKTNKNHLRQPIYKSIRFD
ncbi:MAG: hypothetical protein IJD92_03965 [Bacilli bacterium]|nr:hypothetical protein [Bacilli bacterium]